MLLTENHHPPISFQQHQRQAQHLLQPRSLQSDNLYNSSHHTPFFATPDPDFDLLEANTAAPSLSSSPLSTQSILSQYSNAQRAPLSGFDNIPTIAVPREVQQSTLFDLSSGDTPSFAHSGLMNQDQWFQGQLTPGHPPRFGSSHQREHSLSSLGSAGPASPYSHNVSNPHIAVADSVESFVGLSHGDDFNYQLASKALHGQDTFYANYPNYAPADVASSQNYSNHAMATNSRQQKSLLPPPDFPGTHNGRSEQVSVASSVTSDSPLTPAGDDESERRRKIAFNAIPKLDRTMTDIYSDELFNPNLTITSAPPTQMTAAPSNEVFVQRLQAANSQHLSAAHSPVSAPSRDRSPFQQGSPLAPPAQHDFAANMQNSHVAFNTAQQLREQRKAQQDAQAIEEQLARRSASIGTPQTISPKDALLEYNAGDGEADFPLFPQHPAPPYNNNLNGLKGTAPQTQQSFGGLGFDAQLSNFAPTHLPANMPFPQQFSFGQNNDHIQHHGMTPLSNGSMEPSRVGSTESFKSESTHTDASSVPRPASTSANGGTYTCTYHGCTLRFDTPALLQKHKREGHRQAHGLGGPKRPGSAGDNMTQAGPHRCDRINPSTGKPCDTVFSRPYDLTRHEDTIHNARKQKVHCHLCTEEKSFSRADALTRHFRVCHPDYEPSGRHRRRALH